MNRSTRVLTRAVTALLVLASLFCAGASAALPTSESEAVFSQQLHAKRVESVAINKYTRSMRVTLKDGTQVIARYPKKQSAKTAARLRAAGVTVTFLSKKQGYEEAKKGKKHHHKIRYIVGGVLIVVILLVGGVLLYRRRGTRD
jgi:ATP-dependent Zn protease